MTGLILLAFCSMSKQVFELVSDLHHRRLTFLINGSRPVAFRLSKVTVSAARSGR